MDSLLFIQYGDYREAYFNLSQGGQQKYYAQKHSVDYVSSLVNRYSQVKVLCVAKYYEEEKLSNGVIVEGIDVRDGGFSAVIKAISSMYPTYIVLRTPNREILNYANRNSIKILPILADSFDNNSIKQRIKNWLLSRLLNSNNINCIGNHNLNASSSLTAIGVNGEKVIPWDWPHEKKPEHFLEKTQASLTPKIFYAGQISKAKGVLDLIDAISILCVDSPVILQIAGNDKDFLVRKYLHGKPAEKNTELLGMLSQPEVLSRMASADIVVVPSRHEYPEGLPMTIYEGLLSRTPIIVSDHKMFKNKVVDGESGLIFKAGDPLSLSNKCQLLLSNPDLYSQISKNSAAAWHAMSIKVEWSELVERFLNNEINANFLENNSILSYSESVN
ncbi:glycosyltransferase [Methylophaga sp.]|uniref:glycosyltransferase n=1 Tax=Methylophaga sp. TaxID=2024840 RepID=UPI003A94B5F3